jgi:uncharacterized protein YjbI with pentapeptide repeats
LPTVLLFDGPVDLVSGRPSSLFARNLIVTDEDLVKDSVFGAGDISINLRHRDLRYGIFDRSDLHQADLTGANLTQASLREANLAGVRAEKAVFRAADLRQVRSAPKNGVDRSANGINFRGADLRNANLAQANLQGATLDGALLEGADLRGAQTDVENVAEAKRQGAKF